MPPDPAGSGALRRCLAAYSAGRQPDRAQERIAVKWLLELLVARAPGHSVEVRVVPYAAVQAVPGVRHRRGTPPAVVECGARTWVELATGSLAWTDALSTARLTASGERCDLSGYLPLLPPPGDK